MKIDQWALIAHPLGGAQLTGVVTGHPRFPDYTSVTTSLVVAIEDGKVRTKSGSLYELGEPEPAYEREFPNARARLLAQTQSQSN